MKLGLGTAQFGMNYGITNTTGRPDDIAIENILCKAQRAGIELLDTANAYGVSEESLGRVLLGEHSFKIVTKTLPLGKCFSDSDLQRLKAGIELSFERLKRNHIYALMVHHAEELLQPNGEQIFDVLKDLKQKKCIDKIGISVYSLEILEQVIQNYSIDLIQIPANILDQRIVNSVLIQQLKQDGVEIHVRSAFLQGSLLADPSCLPKQFNLVSNQLAHLEKISKQTGLSKMSLALGFLKQLPEIDKIIIGVQSSQQFDECLMAFHAEIAEEIDYKMFESNELSVIDPSLW